MYYNWQKFNLFLLRNDLQELANRQYALIFLFKSIFRIIFYFNICYLLNDLEMSIEPSLIDKISIQNSYKYKGTKVMTLVNLCSFVCTFWFFMVPYFSFYTWCMACVVLFLLLLFLKESIIWKTLKIENFIIHKNNCRCQWQEFSRFFKVFSDEIIC